MDNIRNMSTISIKIRELRKEKGLTQKELAKMLKTTDDSIYSWEKARSEPSIDFIIKLCDVFDISADYLLGRKEY